MLQIWFLLSFLKKYSGMHFTTLTWLCVSFLYAHRKIFFSDLPIYYFTKITQQKVDMVNNLT